MSRGITRGSEALQYKCEPLEDMTETFFHKVFDINVLGVLLTTQAAVKHMGDGASIVNIGSAESRLHSPNSSVYTATKAAVDALTRVLAKELGSRKIRVNSVNPGFTATEGTAGHMESEIAKGFLANTPLGRAGRPSDIAAAVAFLASDDASWITGEVLFVTGGLGI
jgi:3-oxoacyl-[acyl-carrier protein] reductase